MKDSYKLTRLKLGDLKGEMKKATTAHFYSLFGSKEKEVVVKDEGEKLEERIRKVFEEAYAEGERAGYEMGMKRVEPIIKRLNNCIAELEAFREELKKKAERLAAELSFIIAEAIILKECSVDRNVILSMVRKALEICEKKSEITIRVRPEDLSHLSSNFPSVKILPDETLREPGFIIESNFGDIDGTIRTQIEEIRREIFNFIE